MPLRPGSGSKGLGGGGGWLFAGGSGLSWGKKEEKKKD